MCCSFMVIFTSFINLTWGWSTAFHFWLDFIFIAVYCFYSSKPTGEGSKELISCLDIYSCDVNEIISWFGRCTNLYGLSSLVMSFQNSIHVPSSIYTIRSLVCVHHTLLGVVTFKQLWFLSFRKFCKSAIVSWSMLPKEIIMYYLGHMYRCYL